MRASKGYFSQITISIVLLTIIFFTLLATAWQLRSNRFLIQKFNQNIAVTLINELITKMYLNKAELLKGSDSIYLTNDKKAANLICYYEIAGCAPETIAANDLIYWENAIHDNLPNSYYRISWSEFSKNIIITINWRLKPNSKKIYSISRSIIPYHTLKSVNL